MTFHKYCEIMTKYGLSKSHIPSNKQLAKINEKDFEKSCITMVKIFDEVFSSKKKKD